MNKTRLTPFKTSVEELSIFSDAPPCLPELAHSNKPTASSKNSFLTYVDEIFGNVWFSNSGPLSEKLEHKLAEYLSVSRVVLTNSGTNAMLCLLLSLGIKGEVILPAFTFVSTANLLKILNIKIVFCDIDSETHNLCLEHCESLINENTTAVISTHTWGRAFELEKFESLCRRRGVYLIFDSAHAFGNTYKGRSLTSYGDASVYSFHATKSFHSFEGGAITTEDPELVDKLSKVRNFGFSGFDEVGLVGINAKMTEVCAAMGLSNLENYQHIKTKSEEVYLSYFSQLRDVRGIKVMQYDLNETNNFHYVVVEIDEGSFGISRDKLLKILHAENVVARRYFYPGTHRLKAHFSGMTSLPETELLSEKILVLPAGSNIEQYTVSAICKLIALVGENSEDIEKFFLKSMQSLNR